MCGLFSDTLVGERAVRACNTRPPAALSRTRDVVQRRVESAERFSTPGTLYPQHASSLTLIARARLISAGRPPRPHGGRSLFAARHAARSVVAFIVSRFVRVCVFFLVCFADPTREPPPASPAERE